MKSFKQVALVGVLSASLTACETVNTIKESFVPGNGKPQGALATAISPMNRQQDGLKIRLLGVTDASKGWLNYKFTILNDGPKAIEGLRGILVDVDGHEHNAAMDGTELEKLPSAVDTTLLVGAASLGGMALTFVGFPLIGPLLAGGAMLYQMNKADEWGNTMINFGKVSLTESAIPVNDHVTGSFFFPAVKPAKLKIGYLRGETRNWITLDVTQNENMKPAITAAAQETSKPTTSAQMSLQEVQRRLALLGYEPGTQDGKYGRMTAQALRWFQTDHGLTVTGMQDTATQNALGTM